MPTVLLPIDDHAFARLYSLGTATDLGLANSFMDKTFDITFHVTSPVLSDWSAYLDQMLREVMGEDIAEEWSFDVARLYARRAGGRITPRDLNRQVNAIAALWLQWREEVPFLTVAYYSIFRGALDENLMGSIEAPVVDLAEHDPQWDRNLAAIHFGVPPAHALQVMLEPLLRDSIRNKDSSAFSHQLSFRGWDLFSLN